MQRNRLAVPDLPVRSLGSKHPDGPRLIPGLAASVILPVADLWQIRIAAATGCLIHARGATAQGAAPSRDSGRDNARLDFDMGAAHLNT